MTVDVGIQRACDQILAAVAEDPRFAHTSHLRVEVGGRVVADAHLNGPTAGDVFSVTKSITATVLSALDHRGLLPDLASPIADVLPQLVGTPAESHTWQQVLTMTRGARVDGPWENDAVALLPTGIVDHVAHAPQVRPAGESFEYDNAGPHLLSAAVGEVLGESLADFAVREVFDRIGADIVDWPSDPDGVTWATSGLVISPANLARVGRLWLDGGAVGGRRLLSARFLAAMFTSHTIGGPPERQPYGYLTWLPNGMYMAAGWAGQYMLTIPAADTVIVTTGYPGFELGPPPTDQLPADWQPTLTLIRDYLLPALPCGPTTS